MATAARRWYSNLSLYYTPCIHANLLGTTHYLLPAWGVGWILVLRGFSLPLCMPSAAHMFWSLRMNFNISLALKSLYHPKGVIDLTQNCGNTNVLAPVFHSLWYVILMYCDTYSSKINHISFIRPQSCLRCVSLHQWWSQSSSLGSTPNDKHLTGSLL